MSMRESAGSRRAEQLAEQPAGELVKQLSEQVSRLVREELRLAQAELTQKGKRAGVGAGLFGGGGLIALYGAAAVITAVILLLALAMPAWVAALLVGVVLLAVAGVLAWQGRKQVQQATPPAPQQTAESVRTDVEELRKRAQP